MKRRLAGITLPGWTTLLGQHQNDAVNMVSPIHSLRTPSYSHYLRPAQTLDEDASIPSVPKVARSESFEVAIWPEAADCCQRSPIRGKMETVFAVPVFHVGGSLVPNADGILVYEGGSVEKFDRMDLDLVNFLDLVKLLEDELGYKTKKKLHWLDVADDNLESGLYRLLGDKEINAMRENVLRNFGLSEEFHIYVEHEVSVPHPVENLLPRRLKLL
ncbi:hypothetical protein PIB30_042459 [Stylosanthes scabra]|uniref:PB1-like domain-containing protein n=1 Tax=Stylosanthes scabra TaxID=79078 RepID=A0ABU6VDP9_9FABA|nr:hypothetical protein [Stylosanthes scabra]